MDTKPEQAKKSELQIGAVMHPLPHGISIDLSLSAAQKMMRKYGIRHLPVRDGGRLCGILSERDIDFALRVDQAKPEDLPIKDCLTSEPYAVTADTPLAEVALRMAEDGIGCAVIVDKDNVIGIFTTVDACRVLSRLLCGDPCME